MTRDVVAVVFAAALLSTIGSAQVARTEMPPLALESLTGRDSFDRYCAACHGSDGRGTGPVAAALKSRPADAQLFRTYCASRHGETARGTGPLSAQLRRVAPDLTTYTARNGGVFPGERLRQMIEGRGPAAHGDRTMPVWGTCSGDKRAQPMTPGPVSTRS
jgi:mono/diheme cytochrome c family protein